MDNNIQTTIIKKIYKNSNFYYKLYFEFDELIRNKENILEIIEKNYKKIFLPLNIYFLKIIELLTKLNNYKINLSKYKYLIKTNSIKELYDEYNYLKKKFKWQTSLFYINNYLYNKITIINSRFYNKHRKEIDSNKCIENNCKDLSISKFVFNLLFEKNNAKKNIIINDFFKSNEFNDFYLCVYNNCYKEYLLKLKTTIIHIYSLYNIKSSIKNYNKHLKDFNELYSIFNKRIKLSFDDFIIIIKKYWILYNKLYII